MEQLSPAQEHLSVRAHWHNVSLFHFTLRLLLTGNGCGVFVLVVCCFGLGCVFVVWSAFPGGIVDVFLNLASLDMTATEQRGIGEKKCGMCSGGSQQDVVVHVDEVFAFVPDFGTCEVVSCKCFQVFR